MTIQDITFSPDFLTGTFNATGKQVNFTSSERLLLQALISNAGRVMSRDSLLDALSGTGSDSSERSVDFLVNRLRRKLSNSARSPRFVATHYGEGYVWIGDESRLRTQPSQTARFVIGPIYGAPSFGPERSTVQAILAAIVNGVESASGAKGHVEIDPKAPLALSSIPTQSRTGIAVSFVTDKSGIASAVLTTRKLEDGKTLAVGRIGRGQLLSGEEISQHICDLLGESWQVQTEIDSTGSWRTPYLTRLHEAVQRVAGVQNPQSYNERKARRDLVKKPNDPVAMVQLAAALHSRFILQRPLHFLSIEAAARLDREIEKLCLKALPFVTSHDELAFTTAKLLYFLNPAHRALAMEIAEGRLHDTIHLGSGYAAVGQMRMWAGRGEDAIDLLERGRELVASNSPRDHARGYFAFLLAQAYSAQGEHKKATQVLTPILENAPLTVAFVSLFYDFEPNLSAWSRKQVLRLTTRSMATSLLRMVEMCVARHMISPEMQVETFRIPYRNIIGQYGADIFPSELHQRRTQLEKIFA